MYSDVNFHELSEAEKRRLVRTKRVASTDGLLNDIPEGEPPVRVFESPLEDLVLDRLGEGRFSLEELAEKYTVRVDDIRPIIRKFRRHGREGFPGDSFKSNLLNQYNGIIRVKEIEGKRFLFSLETVPFFARIADPTLFLSLLAAKQLFKDFPTIIDDIPAGAASDVDEMYSLLIGEFWNIDEQVVFDNITEYDRTYVETAIAPLPIVDEIEGYEDVQRRFSQPDSVYERFRNVGHTAEEIGNEFLEIADRGQPGLRSYQAVGLELADLRRAARLQTNSKEAEFETIVENVVGTLHPDTVDDILSQSEVDATPGEVPIETAIQAELGDQWRTTREIHESIVSEVQGMAPLKQVREELQRLSGLGVIASRTTRETLEYRSGTENSFDVDNS